MRKKTTIQQPTVGVCANRLHRASARYQAQRNLPEKSASHIQLALDELFEAAMLFVMLRNHEKRTGSQKVFVDAFKETK